MSTEELDAIQNALAGVLSIEREIGRGGMGTVYLARDVALDRPVALKVLHAELGRDPALRARFLREARTGARLSHPHIVPIYDVGESDQHVWIVMGLVDGESLGSQVARRGGLGAEAVERLLREIGWALANAHARGILHRDVSLDNILIERRTGRAMLADFGIAAPIHGAADVELVGTASYIAPELIHGDPPSAQSDLYALGVVGWASLTGFLPFADEDAATVLLRRLHEEIPPLERAAAATPRRLRTAIEALLARRASDRPTSAEAWLESVDEPTAAAQLAEPLTSWVEVRAAVAPYFALTMVMIAFGSGMLLRFLSGSLLEGVVAIGLFGAVVVPLIPLSAQGAIALQAIRRLLRSGYRLEDMRLALDRHISARRRLGRIPPTPLGRLIHRSGTLGGLLALLVVVIADAGAAMPWHVRFLFWDIGMPVLKWGLLWFWVSRGIGFLVPGRVTPVVDRRLTWRVRFWNSRLGEWAVRLMRVGLPRTILAERTLHRPTELMLDLQIEQLWEALPAPTRESLHEVPRLARDLRKRIQELRALLERTNVTGSSTPELSAIRERMERRRTDATTALERLRLLVTKLGTAAASPGDFTRDLREARAVEGEILRDLGAHQDIHHLLLASRLSPTPA